MSRTFYTVTFKKTPRSRTTLSWTRAHEPATAEKDVTTAVQGAYPKAVIVTIKKGEPVG